MAMSIEIKTSFFLFLKQLPIFHIHQMDHLCKRIWKKSFRLQPTWRLVPFLNILRCKLYQAKYVWNLMVVVSLKPFHFNNLLCCIYATKKISVNRHFNIETPPPLFFFAANPSANVNVELSQHYTIYIHVFCV